MLPIAFRLLLCLFLVPHGHTSDYEILRETRFDSGSFTQGFIKAETGFYVSSGGYGHSFIAHMDDKGRTLKRIPLNKQVFAEGLTIHQETLYVLSWKSGWVMRFQLPDLSFLDALPFNGEGWGLTHTPTHFLLSDGSSVIQFKRLDNFDTVKTLPIHFQGAPLSKINELEFAEGYLWANVWHDDHIYQIDINSGEAIQRWDLSKIRLSLELSHSEAVLNGIAYDKAERAFWLTGKLWPKRYLLRFHHVPSSLNNQGHAETYEKSATANGEQ